MSRRFASFFLNHRIARSRWARVLAFVLALLLVAGNLVAATMPPPATSAEHAGGSVHSASTAVPDGHCEHAAAPAAYKKATPHKPGCPCCVGGDCACAQVCGDVFVIASIAAAPLPQAGIAVSTPAAIRAAIRSRPLRPPIV